MSFSRLLHRTILKCMPHLQHDYFPHSTNPIIVFWRRRCLCRHACLSSLMSFNESELPRGPGFWKFNNSLLSDTNYVELLSILIPMFAKKHEQTKEKRLYWEMIKIELCAFTIAFSKKKAKRKRDEESILLSQMMRLQTKLQTSYSDSLKTELD